MLHITEVLQPEQIFIYLSILLIFMSTRGSLVVWFVVLVLVVGVTLVLYLSTEDESTKLGLLIALILVAVAGGGTLAFEYLYKPNIVRRKIAAITERILQETSETLTRTYMDLYALYMKLSEKQKANFYGRVVRVRELLEDQMKAEKQLQELLANAGKNGLEALKKEYETASMLLQQLSNPVKEKYALDVAHLKDKLEKGI